MRNNGRTEVDFTPPVSASISEITRRLEDITRDFNKQALDNPQQLSIDPAELHLSMGEAVKERVKASHAELFEHAKAEIDHTMLILKELRHGLEVRHAEADQKTEEFCLYINDILLKNTNIRASAEQLGHAVLDNRVA